MTSVHFLLYEGFSNMVLSCLLEPLRAVRDLGQAEIEWRVLSASDAPVRSSSGLSISPDLPMRDSGACDLLVVVSGYGYHERGTGREGTRLRQLAQRAQRLLGADMGAWILAEAGLLEGARVTLHWAAVAEFAEAFPTVPLSYERYVKEGRVWSCGGASTALDLILAFIADRFGPANAFLASTLFLQDAQRPQQQENAPVRLAGKGSAKLRRCVTLMAETLETPLPLARLAELVGLTTRTLDRLFKTELGLPPGRYYQQLRLLQARDLAANTEYDLSDIALRCGYSDAPALCKAFRRAYGHSIRKSRGARPH